MKDTSASPILRVLLPPRCVVTETTRYYYYFFVEPSFPSFKERNIGGGEKGERKLVNFFHSLFFFIFSRLKGRSIFIIQIFEYPLFSIPVSNYLLNF